MTQNKSQVKINKSQINSQVQTSKSQVKLQIKTSLFKFKSQVKTKGLNILPNGRVHGQLRTCGNSVDTNFLSLLGGNSTCADVFPRSL